MPSDEDNWGPGQLGRSFINAHSDFDLTNIKPGEYDIKVVDHDGDGCIRPSGFLLEQDLDAHQLHPVAMRRISLNGGLRNGEGTSAFADFALDRIASVRMAVAERLGVFGMLKILCIALQCSLIRTTQPPRIFSS